MKSKKKLRTKIRDKVIRDKTRKGGGKKVKEMEEKELRIMQQKNNKHFRDVFFTAYNDLVNAVKMNEPLKDAIVKIKEVFENNKSLLNILILVTHNHIPIDKETYTSNTQFVRFEPALVVLFSATPDSSTRKEFVNSFIKNGGDLHLKSIKGNLSALSQAIELEDKSLIAHLFSKGLSKNILNKEQIKKLQELMKTEDKPKSVTNKKTKSKKTQKTQKLLKSFTNVKNENLLVNTPAKPQKNVSIPERNSPNKSANVSIPENNDPNKSANANEQLSIPERNAPNKSANVSIPEMNDEPEFWKPFFKPNEMTTLKIKLNEMMKSDCLIKGNEVGVSKIWEVSDLWTLCKINKSIIPTYFVPTQNNRYEVFDSLIQDEPDDFARYQILLCASLLVFGIISKKLEGHDYTLLFKGGKAIQMALAHIPNTPIYPSEDIDVIIVPKKVQMNQEEIKNLAGHISYLVKWFLNDPELKFMISVQEPVQDQRAEVIVSNPSIFKLSYVKNKKRNKYKNITGQYVIVDDYRQFSDIDFGKIEKDKLPFFEDVMEYSHEIKELNQSVLFKFPTIESLLSEKIYYYTKYAHFWEILYGVTLNTTINDTILERMYRDKDPKKIKEKGYENVSPNDCNRFLEKFKRAILALNKGLQKKKFPHLKQIHEEEINSIRDYLTKIPKDKEFKERIIRSLYYS